MDRVPPHSPEAEDGMLGCILLSPADCMGQCVDKLKGNSDVFYDLRNQTIFSTLVQMYESREAIDVITLQQSLKDKQLLDQVGGIAWISGLPDLVPSAANLSYYADIVLEKFLLRKAMTICTDAVASVYEHEGDVYGLLDDIEKKILSIRALREARSTPSIKQLVAASIEDIEGLHIRKGKLPGIETGFPDYDNLTGGLIAGDMIVIAGRPSMGKTSLAMNIAEHVALDVRDPVGIFSLEMTARSLVTRAICSRAKVNIRNVRDGFLVDRDFPKITGAAGRFSTAPIYIDDTSGISVLQLRAKARRMCQQYGVKLFVIDYLQKLHSTNKKARNRQEEVADIACGIKDLAKELNVPIIVVSQLNRVLEKDKLRKPNLSDLRESGAIEQEGDVIGLLYKPKKKGEEVEGPVIPVNLLIAKQRNGDADIDVELVFMKQYTRFESASKVEVDDSPERQMAIDEYRPPHKD